MGRKVFIETFSGEEVLVVDRDEMSDMVSDVYKSGYIDGLEASKIPYKEVLRKKDDAKLIRISVAVFLLALIAALVLY